MKHLPFFPTLTWPVWGHTDGCDLVPWCVPRAGQRSLSRSTERLLEGPWCSAGEPQESPPCQTYPLSLMWKYCRISRENFTFLFPYTWGFIDKLTAKQHQIENCCNFVFWMVKAVANWQLLQKTKFCFPPKRWCSVSRATEQRNFTHALLFRSLDQGSEFKKTQQLRYKIDQRGKDVVVLLEFSHQSWSNTNHI